MLRRAITALGCAVLMSGLAVAPAGAIVGGQVAPPGRWPWLAALIDKEAPDDFLGQFCGGAVISPRRVLTAAHCVYDASPRQITVLLGRTRLTGSGGRHVAVRAIHLDPQWPREFGRDAAVLTLAAPAGVPPLALARYGQAAAWAPGATAWAMGWGALNGDYSPGGQIYFADRLRQAAQPIVSDDACENVYGGGNAVMTYRRAWSLCAGQLAAGGPGTCWGDSGGPLVVGSDGAWLEVGIVFGGDGCASPGYYDMYTRADQVRAFALGTLTHKGHGARRAGASAHARLRKGSGRLPLGNRRLFAARRG